jgi:hypothetical protein
LTAAKTAALSCEVPVTLATIPLSLSELLPRQSVVNMGPKHAEKQGGTTGMQKQAEEITGVLLVSAFTLCISLAISGEAKSTAQQPQEERGLLQRCPPVTLNAVASAQAPGQLLLVDILYRELTAREERLLLCLPRELHFPRSLLRGENVTASFAHGVAAVL